MTYPFLYLIFQKYQTIINIYKQKKEQNEKN